MIECTSCEICNRDALINDSLCGECRFKIDNWDEAIFLLKECADLIEKTIPDCSAYREFLEDRVDKLLANV